MNRRDMAARRQAPPLALLKSYEGRYPARVPRGAISTSADESLMLFPLFALAHTAICTTST